MKIAILGDAHLIADSDPYKQLHSHRAFFKRAWPSFRRLLTKVNEQSPDLTIFLGDLVDWFSPANIAFGLDLLSQLKSPWHMTPGNHDLAAPADGPEQATYKTAARRDHIGYWSEQGVDLSTRTLDINGATAVLLDSALSDLAAGDETLLAKLIKQKTPRFLCTHVPIDRAPTRAYILSVDPRRSMKKYVLSGAPHLYGQYIENRIADVFSAHLHFSGDLHHAKTRFHLCNMSITMSDPNRSYSTIATARMIEFKKTIPTFSDLTVE